MPNRADESIGCDVPAVMRLRSRSARGQISGFGDEVIDCFASRSYSASDRSGTKELLEARRGEQRGDDDHERHAAEEAGVEDAGSEADLGEDQADLAARDHTDADDRLVAAEPERGVAGGQLAGDADHDEHAADEQGEPASPAGSGLRALRSTDAPTATKKRGTKK